MADLINEMIKNESHELRVQHLSEALPYIQKFTNKIFVIKYGGSALTDSKIAQSVIKDLVLLNSVNIKTVLVHGGGPEINEMLSKIGKEISFENGLRKTDSETLEIVEMVLSGKIQRRLVSMINCTGAKAIGLNGRDGRIIVAERLEGMPADNMVGQVKKLNLGLIYQLFDLGLIPVISSIAPNEIGEAFNINADTLCAEIAAELKAEKMILMTDVPGLLEDVKNPDSLISELSLNDAQAKIDKKEVSGGMIPKLECCINGLKKGVKEAIILNGLTEHSLLMETFTDKGSGTRVSS
jgi:acetylglutamate kinase